MNINCSSENDHSWMFLVQEAKQRGEDPLSKFAQELSRNVVFVIDAIFCVIKHIYPETICHAMEIKKHS